MKLIRCYTRKENLDQIRHKLFELGAPGMSVTEAKGIGKPMSQIASKKGEENKSIPQFRDRICIEIVVEDESLDEFSCALTEICRTGSLGDGKIFIIPVDDAIRVRTGERGIKSLY